MCHIRSKHCSCSFRSRVQFIKKNLVQSVYSLNAAFVINNETSVCETACIELSYIVLYEIWGSYNGKYEYYCILRSDAVYFGT